MRVAFEFRYPFIPLLLALMGGIVLNARTTFLIYLLIFLFTFATLLFFFHRFSNLINYCLLIAVFCLGSLISYHPPEAQRIVRGYPLKTVCEEQLAHNNYILSSNGTKFYLSHFYTDTIYRRGDSLSFHAHIYPIRDNSNIGEFSYARYLQQKKVYYKVIPIDKIQKTGYSRKLSIIFEHIRRRAIHKINRLVKDSTHSAIISALCLGYRDDLANETRHLFITTGTIHLLCVSGLHTGAVYLLLLFLLKQTGLSGRKSRIILLPLLWAYACLTGLSPAVVRAATILSFISIGQAFSRDYIPLNAIAASAFFTLLINPELLYSVSFQLSYCAYTGIITLYPFLYELPGKLPALPAKLYASVCISIAAQLPTLPICAFYFHTINMNSFLINVIAIPTATLLLYTAGILFLLPASIGCFLVFLPNFICNLLLKELQLFEPITFNIYHLYPPFITVILLYLCLFFISRFLQIQKIQQLYLATLSLILLTGQNCVQNLHQMKKQEIIVFHHHQHSAILLNYRGFYSFLKKNTSLSPDSLPYIKQNALQALPSTGILYDSLFYYKNKLISGQQTIVILDKNTSSYPSANILIVTENLHPQTVFTAIPTPQYPYCIIIDGSNNSFTLRQWASFCIDKGIKLLSTKDIGAIRLTLK